MSHEPPYQPDVPQPSSPEELTPTRANVRRLAEEARGTMGTPVNNCSTLSNNLRVALQQDLGIRAEVKYGKVGDGRGNTANHAFVVIPAGELDDVAHPLIVDISLDQFTQMYYDHGNGPVDISLGTKSSVPDIVITNAENPDYQYTW